jgi:hypothetical protein
VELERGVGLLNEVDGLSLHLLYSILHHPSKNCSEFNDLNTVPHNPRELEQKSIEAQHS